MNPRRRVSHKAEDAIAYLALATAQRAIPSNNPFLTQAVWFVDPANSTGLASDNNSGLTATTPLLTWSQIVQRWGSITPLLPQTTVIKFLSSQPVGVDNIVARPIMGGVGSAFFILGGLT